MASPLHANERRVLAVLQDGLPQSWMPFQGIALRVGITASEVLDVLRKWKPQDKLRRIGAIVNHFRVGLGAGAMVVWQVESSRVEEVGRIFAGFQAVSHVYERQTCEGWPYNIYTTVHAASIEQLRSTIDQMTKACGITNYRVLVTERELKKVPPKYVIR